MARCPNCDASVSWDAAQCASCAALFGEGSQWQPLPEGWEEARKLDRRPTAPQIPVASRPRLASRKFVTGLGVAATAWFFISLMALGRSVKLWSAVAIGAALCLGSLFFWGRALSLRYGRGRRTQGKLIEWFTSGTGRSYKAYPVVEFSPTAGSTIRFDDTAADRPWTEFKVGQAIEVLYDPDDTEHAYALVKGRLVLPYVGWFLVGAIVLVATRLAYEVMQLS